MGVATRLILGVLAVLFAGCAAVSPARGPEAASAASDRAWNGLVRIAVGPPWELTRESAAEALDVSVTEFEPFPFEGQPGTVAGYTHRASIGAPYFQLQYLDLWNQERGFRLSVVDEPPARVTPPLPYCFDAVRTTARMEELGWIFVRNNARRGTSGGLEFKRAWGDRHATLRLWFAAAGDGLGVDCITRMDVAPEMGSRY